MNIEESLNYIHSLGRFGSKPGLERIEKLLSLMGNPHESLKIIHVAGTNGKGSTSTYIANALYKAGFNVGLYTSPYITQFNERITINGEMISNEELARYTDYTASLAKKVFSEEHPITEFEFITALAFKYYADKKCDVVVLEVGLGGRLDATNVIKKPLASVITKIDLDHTGILGDTVEQIAAEKCGIIKKQCPVITTAQNDSSVLDVISDFATKNHSEMYLNDSKSVDILSSDINGNVFNINGFEYQTKMTGAHQVDNALTAIKTLRTVFPEISKNYIYEGIRKASLPARCEVISKEPLVILDGSHNSNGTSALFEYLKSCGFKKCTAIAGFMADKDVSDAVSKVAPLFEQMICVEVKSNKRSMSAEALKEVCSKYCVNVMTADDYSEAIRVAKSFGRPIIVFGSLYLAGDIRPLFLSEFMTKED